PIKSSLLGAIVTAIVQSSSATTVITVSLVNMGLLSFSQSLGIIFGANVGTTITAQLVAFKLTSFAPIFIILGFLLKFFGGKYKLLGKPLFFFGLVFYGLMLISNNIAPIQEDQRIIDFFANFSNIFIALAVGFVFTAIVQSSSVTTGLVVVLAQNGLLDLKMGIPLLIGANIGSSTTALLASLDLNLYAKRVGFANFLFNIGGAIIFVPFLGLFIVLIQFIGGNVAQQIANAHMIFNIATLIIFLIVMNPFKKAVEKIIAGEEEEILFRSKHLQDPLPKDNLEVIKLIKKEIVYSIEITIKIYEKAINMFKHPKKAGFMQLEKLETLNDFLDDKITNAILVVSNRKLSRIEAKKSVLLVQISNAIEQLGDLGEDLSDVSKDLFEKGIDMSYESIEAVDKIFIELKKNLVLMKSKFPDLSKSTIIEIKKREDHILSLISQKYEDHMNRLHEEKEEYSGSTFVESVSIIETSVSKQREIRKFIQRYRELK
ncbi:Na/Pi cotransporter family protein, partial [Candidatus Woesearchaeota archaeon]|nr:Na/Pi cotransporter family protein [Candidatus Woesearchaeota archaeon]